MNAGLVKSQAHFEDIYGLDNEVNTAHDALRPSLIVVSGLQLLAMVSQPVKAVLLVFPITDVYEQKRREEDRRIATEGQHPVDPTVFWMKQTVSQVSLPSLVVHGSHMAHI